MLPAKFVERVLRELGPDEGGALCRALTGEPSVSVRLNAAKGLAAPSGRPIGWSSGGYWLDARPSFTLDPDFHAGRYYVQEASSQFVGHIVAACGGIRGGRVLDLCAAPGGKTTLYSTLAGRGGLVVANEIVRNRAAVLADNVRKWGVGNVAVTVNDPSQVARLEGWFDAVAVDAPCSGEGCSASWRRRARSGARPAWRCAPNGRGVFCAKRGGPCVPADCCCTAPVPSTLRRTKECCATSRCGRPARPNLPNGSRSIRRGASCAARRVISRPSASIPTRWRARAFFAAAVRKRAAGGERRRVPRPQRDPLAWADRRAVQELERWVEEPEAMRFAAVGDTFYGYWQPQTEAVAMLSGVLNVIASGGGDGTAFQGRSPAGPCAGALHGAAPRGCGRVRVAAGGGAALPASRRGGCRPFRGRDESGDGRRCGAGIRQADRAPLQQSVSEFAQDTQRIGR